eukprot:1728451-Amphidinium_carterae.1
MSGSCLCFDYAVRPSSKQVYANLKAGGMCEAKSRMNFAALSIEAAKKQLREEGRCQSMIAGIGKAARACTLEAGKSQK